MTDAGRFAKELREYAQRYYAEPSPDLLEQAANELDARDTLIARLCEALEATVPVLEAIRRMEQKNAARFGFDPHSEGPLLEQIRNALAAAAQARKGETEK